MVNKPKTITEKENQFCELYVFGCDPYGGNARKCYADVYNCKDASKCLMKARDLMSRNDVHDYLLQLQTINRVETGEIKQRLTEKLLHIIDETSAAEFYDRRGVKLSVAPLRAVAVQASRALMDMYPVRVAQESKLELNGNGEQGIVFNVIVPNKKETNESLEEDKQ